MPASNSRLIILADMGNEPDEKQQMVHMLMYANEIDIEGLIAVTGKWLRTSPRPDIFTDLINEYARVVDNLKLRATGWPDADYLHAVTAGGRNNYGIDDVGAGKSSDGSRLITDAVLSDSWIDTVYGKNYNDIGTPVVRWRRAELNDFKARMDWCVKTFENANHNPVINFNGDDSKAIVHLYKWPGQVVVLDASASTDPDGDTLTFQWYNYPEVTTYNGSINISDAKKSKAMFKVPSDADKEQIHIILEVTDVNDIAHLTSYRRIVIDVDSDADTTEPNVSVPSPEKEAVIL